MTIVTDFSAKPDTPVSGRKPSARVPLPKTLAKTLPKKLLVIGIGLIVPAALLALWQTAVVRGWVAEQLLPPPSLVLLSIRELWQSGDLQSHILITLQRIGWSLVLGGAGGLALGFAMGLSRTLRIYIQPTFLVVAQLPVIGWIPLLIILLGIGESLKIAAITLAVFVPFAVNTSRGMAQVPGSLIEVARAYHFNRSQTFFRVILPGALPELFAGLRQGVMQAWLSLVFIELLASSEGIGYLMVWGRQLLQMDLVVVGMLVIGAFGFGFELLLAYLEKRLLVWRRAWN
jgi:sulfonate transport system permease protein